MPKKPIKIPKFRTIEEEADWWEGRAGKRTATELMKRAVDAGKVKRRRLVHALDDQPTPIRPS